MLNNFFSVDKLYNVAKHALVRPILAYYNITWIGNLSTQEMYGEKPHPIALNFK